MRDPLTVLDRLARTLAHQAGVKVIVGGDQAFTDGTAIFLPALPEPLTQEQWRVTGGTLNHECAHCLFSDFTAIPADPMLAQILNTLEDPRVEDRFCRRYPGGRADLVTSHSSALAELAGRAPSMEPYQLRLLALLCHLDGSAPPECVGSDALTWSATWARCRTQVLAAATTGDLLPLAEAIRADLFRLPPRNAPDQSMGTKPQEDGAAEGAAASSSMSPGTSSADAGPDHQAPSPHALTGSGDGGTLAASGANGSGAVTNTPALLPDPIAPVQSESLLSTTLRKQVSDFAKGPGYHSKTIRGPLPLRSGDGTGLKVLAARTVPGLARRLARAVEADSQSRWLPDQERGSLDPRRLHRLVNGRSKRIFRRLERGERVDTAVTLLVDASGSMQGSEHTAAAAAMVVATSLDRLRVTTEVLTFSDRNMGLAKAFGDPMSVLADRLISIKPSGGTPLGEVLLTAVKRLIHQPAERFIAMVVTDGQPASADYCAEILKRCAAVGIETIGVGIHVDISHLFSQSITIASIDQLAPALLGQVRSVLLSSRHRTPSRRSACRH